MRLRMHLLAAVSGLTMLSSCGGSGSTPTPTPTPPTANRPPSFTSPSTASAAENAAGTIYTAAATDPDGNALTYSISGGIDRALFALSGAALSFTAPPDFEAPGDADANNVYLVQLTVSDGQASATLDLSVTVTNVGPDGFRVTRIGTGFASPLFAAAVPDGSGRIFIVQQGGQIRILTPSTGAIAATPFLNLTGQVSTDGERGLLGFATAPDFATSGTFYVFLTNLSGDIEVRRYRTQAGNRDIADPATGDIIFTAPHSSANNHNGGWIGFGPDGFLYIAIGDGGGGGDPSNNAQNTNVMLGKLHRIDVSGDDFPADASRDYRIPAGNPFASGAGGLREIWAYGLRNPFRNSFDSVTGNLWIGDVGQGAREEIDLMRPTDGGANFGWRVLEGTAVFNGTPTAGMVPPVAEYLHGSGDRQGNSVTGGHVYRGPVEALQGHYIFGDFVTGNIFSFPIRSAVLGSTIASSAFTLRRAAFAPNAGTIGNIASFGVDQAGNLLIVDYDGEIFRLEAS